MIGRGNFADVQLAKEKSSGKVGCLFVCLFVCDANAPQVYALKVMKKVGENAPAFYCEERDIMAR